MKKNEESNKVSLSSWNYGCFFHLNPCYSQRPSSSLKSNKEEINNLNAKKISKLTNDDHLLNIPFEQYIDRDRYIHIDYIRNLTNQRIESKKMVKQNGKTFTDWEKQKKEKKNKNDKTKPILEEKENKNEQEPKDFKKTFKDWKKAKIKIKKKEEKKRLKSENQKKVENDKINNERREKMLLWLKKKDELIKNKKASERKIKKQKKIEEEKNNKEKNEKNKQIFIQWLRNKIKKKQINKQKDDSKEQNKKHNYEKNKYEEIIGPFHFSQQIKEAQKNFYKNLNKANTSQSIKRSNTSKK